jgi:hypothetical protein
VRPRQPSTTSCNRWLGGGGRPLVAAQAQAPALLPPAANGRLQEALLLQACGWAASTQGNFCWCVEGEKMPTSCLMDFLNQVSKWDSSDKERGEMAELGWAAMQNRMICLRLSGMRVGKTC